MNAETPKQCSFYECLKNAQPLAFLASLSIVIAAFTYTNIKVPNVYVDAVIASFAFLFSFIFSLISQLYKPEVIIFDLQKGEDKYSNIFVDYFLGFCRYGVYFFLIIGIIYLLLVAFEFSKTHLQLYSILFAWAEFFVGTMTLALGVKALTFIKRLEVKPINIIIISIVGTVIGGGFAIFSILI